MAYIKKYLNSLSAYGVSGKDFENQKEKLTKKFGQPASDGDTLWSLFNLVILKTTDLQDQKMIYFTMALYLNEEGKDSFKENAAAAKLELQILKELGCEKVEILCNSGCIHCNINSGKIFDLKEAFENMPIPNPRCTYDMNQNGKPFCRCTYLPVVNR
ncbi:MAG: hypothetical protein WCV88_00380 [Patescibacteria group bacterium]